MGGAARIGGIIVPETDNFYEFDVPMEPNYTISDSFILENDWVNFISSEHMFQYLKCTNSEDKKLMAFATSSEEAWEIGQGVKLRDDWEKIKVDAMLYANKEKFKYHTNLCKILAKTDGDIICTGSSPFWNKYNAIILEIVRLECRLIVDGHSCDISWL